MPGPDLRNRLSVRQKLRYSASAITIVLLSSFSSAALGQDHEPQVSTSATPADGAGAFSQSNDANLPAAANVPSDSVEAVVVTSSRVSRQGFVAPTPTTVLTSTDLSFGGATNIGSVLATLPSYAPTTSATSTRGNVNPGQNTANLRDLGTSRTLVLIDGARPVATYPAGSAFGFDLNMLPDFLVKRVEVVTGGASAQWGSDAVAGVINIVMDDGFEGFKAQLQNGGDTQGLASNEAKIDMAYGTTFDGGRGHVMFGIGVDDIRGVGRGTRTPAGQYGLIANPNYTATNGQPQELFVSPLLNSNASYGGLIVSGPLKGTKFLPGGAVGTFQYGQYGTLGNFMVGGDPEATIFTISGNIGMGQAISPVTRGNFYGKASFDVSNHTTLTFDVLVGSEQTKEHLGYDTYLGNLTIQNTNAYLPSTIVSQMAAAKITSFAFGRDNADFGEVFLKSISETQQAKLGAKGDFGGGWFWDAFYSYGATEHEAVVGNQPITANFANSVNAVKSPTTGQPVCAVTLTDPTSTCVPVDLFGNGSVSPAALNYFQGAAILNFYLYQHEAAFNIHGDLFSLPAGPISIASGVEFRHVGIGADVNALDQAKALAFNDPGYETPGSYNVGEGYLETVAPLLKNSLFAQELDFNGAVRVSDYSTSGVIPSWKVGLTDTLSDGIRLRGTISHDIRAPNLQELYFTQAQAAQNVINPLTNKQYTATVYTGGNPNLKPELANTYTVGATYQPNWIKGVNLTVDYYSIKVNNAVATLAAQTVVNQCYSANISAACANITLDSNGGISVVQGTYINIASYNTSGVDFEADYSTDLEAMDLPGLLGIKWLGTYINTLKQLTGSTLVPLASDISAGLPRWRSNLALDYSLDEFDFTARARYVGGGAYSLAQTVNTSVAAQVYYDLGIQWSLPTDTKISLYGNVNNVFNNLYPVGIGANSNLFDYIGRTYNAGIRVSL